MPDKGTIVLLLSLQVIAAAILLGRLRSEGLLNFGDVLTRFGLGGTASYASCGWLNHTDFGIVSTRVLVQDPDLTGQLDGVLQSAAVHIKNGKIDRVVPLPSAAEPISEAPEALKQTVERLLGAQHVLDFGSAVIMPGLIDCHVHMDEPGRTDWEGADTATRAAAAGGITTLVDMPLNNHPCTTSGDLVQQKIAAVKDKIHVNVGFWGGMVPSNAHNHSQLQSQLDAGVLGFKSFMIASGLDDFAWVNRTDIQAALPFFKLHGVPYYVHAEVADNTQPEGDARRYATYLASRPRSWEKTAVDTLLDALQDDTAGAPAAGFCLHIAHLSDAGLLPELAAAKKKGLPVTVETCPHYLHFTSETVPDGDTRHKCAPPLREAANRDALLAGLRDGTIDMVATDHSPAPPEMRLLKAGDFMRAWGGIAGLQYALPVTWQALGKGDADIPLLAKLWATEPARLAGVHKHTGKIAAGYDADIVVWDPKALADTSASALQHRHKQTPYADAKLHGSVVATFVRGHLVFSQADGPTPQACGSLVLRSKTARGVA